MNHLPPKGTAGMLALALGVLAGCGGDATTNSGDAPEALADTTVVEAREEVLNTFTVGDQEVTFVRYATGESEEDEVLAMHVVSKIGEVDQIGTLQAREGDLTFLELHRTLAPEGQQPHPALLKSHPQEALAFGRSNLAAKALGKVNAAAVAPVPPPSCGVTEPCPPISLVTCSGSRATFTADRTFTFARRTPSFSSEALTAHLCVGGTGAYDSATQGVIVTPVALSASTCSGVTPVTTATVTASVCVHNPGETRLIPDPTGQSFGRLETISGASFITGYTSTTSAGRSTFTKSSGRKVLAGTQSSTTFNKPSGAASHMVFGAASRNDNVSGDRQITLGASKR